MPWHSRAGLLLAALACAALAADTTPIQFTQVAQAAIQHRLERVTRKLADRKAVLESLFQEVGCTDDRFAEQPVPGSKAPNLICTLPGQTDGEIVVGGHIDSIEVGMGAVDDWSGSVLLPSLYQSLKDTPRRHRFVFVGFAAEERGLWGSSAFVKKLPREERQRIGAMINLECHGVGPPKVWASRADRRLLEDYVLVASSLHIEPRAVNVERVGDDDSHPFLDARIPVLTIHSLTNETLGILHSSRDIPGAIHPDDYYDAYHLAATYLAYLDSKLE